MPSRALSQGISSKKMLADLPPSSSVAGITFFAAASATVYPTAVEPVNASLRISGWSSMYWPAVEPWPVMMLSTPSGRTCAISFVISRRLTEVEEDGFIITQLPAASAGAIFQAAISSGKFHGIIWPTTPIGSRTIKLSISLSR